MKTRKSLVMLILSTMLTAGVAKAASEPPIQCKLQQGNIECTVVSDNVEVTNVILNRGRCAAPEATTQKDIEALNEFRNKLQPVEREVYFSEDGRPTSIGVYGIMGRTITRDVDQNIEKYGDAYLRVAFDPRRKYGFGDTVTILARSCSNLIEFTIEANGQNWTWKTNQ